MKRTFLELYRNAHMVCTNFKAMPIFKGKMWGNVVLCVNGIILSSTQLSLMLWSQRTKKLSDKKKKKEKEKKLAADFRG